MPQAEKNFEDIKKHKGNSVILKDTVKHVKNKLSEQAYNPIWISGINKEWEEMIPYGQKLTFKPKKFIPPYHNGEKGFYYLKYGKVRVTYTDQQNKEITVYHLGEGTLLYEIASNINFSTRYNVYAITPVEVYFFKESNFLNEEFALTHPKLILNVISAQSYKNMHYMRRLVNIASGNAFSNTCKLMLDLSRNHGNALEVPLGVTHEEIASLLCVRRSWLGKILRRLKDEKIISRCTKSRLVISNLEKLEEYANQ